MILCYYYLCYLLLFNFYYYYYIYSQGLHEKQINPAYFHCGPFGLTYTIFTYIIMY